MCPPHEREGEERGRGGAGGTPPLGGVLPGGREFAALGGRKDHAVLASDDAVLGDEGEDALGTMPLAA